MKKPLTIQQILDKATKGVMAQGRLSKNVTTKQSVLGTLKDEVCFYRHPEVPGCACGVGHLIDPQHYDPAAENTVARSVRHITNPDVEVPKLGTYRLGASLVLSGVDIFDDAVVQALAEIQSEHDCAGNLEQFRQGAARLYVKRDLPVPEWLS